MTKKEGCACGNDKVYLCYCMDCLRNLELEAEQRGWEAALDSVLDMSLLEWQSEYVKKLRDNPKKGINGVKI